MVALSFHAMACTCWAALAGATADRLDRTFVETAEDRAALVESAGNDAVAVIAVGDPPLGPTGELAELTHQLRAACRERAAQVEDVATMRTRFGQVARARLGELERAYVGAQAAFQADEIDSAARTFRGIADDLERLPESGEAFSLWVRVQLRIALAERTMGHRLEMMTAMERIVAVEPDHAVDPEQFAPSFRRDFEDARRRVAAGPRRTLTITSTAGPVTAYVNGRSLGATPASIALPPGRYRVGGAAGALRAPAVELELGDHDRTVELDVALAEGVRLDGGPGLAIAKPDRSSAILRTGRWLEAARVIAVERAGAPDARQLTATLHDARAGTVIRKASIRLGPSGTAAAVAALASFLLTGQGSDEVVQLVPPPRPDPIGAARGALARRPSGEPDPASVPLGPSASGPAPISSPFEAPPSASVSRAVTNRSPWLVPAAYAAGATAVGLAALGLQQALSARGAYGDASALVRADGALVPGADRARYDATVARGEAANRNAYLAAAGAVAFAATAGVLGYLSWDARGAPVVRF